MVSLTKTIYMVSFKFKQYKPINVVVRTSTPVDEFHFDSCVPTHVGTHATIVSNPLFVLFNAERLNSLGNFPLQEWIDAMNSIKSDPFQELRKHISDDELISLMKSRYCQEPCELANWTAYLSDNMDKLTAQAQEIIKNEQFSSIEQQSSSVITETKTE